MNTNNTTEAFDPKAWADLTPETGHSQSYTLDSPSAAQSIREAIIDEVRDIAQQIVSQGIDITSGYQNWLNLGFALADELGEDGRSIYHDLSRMNAQYGTSDCDKQYSACLRDHDGRVTIKSFFYMAKQAGITLHKPKEFPPLPPLRHFGAGTQDTQRESADKGEYNSNIQSSTIYPSTSELSPFNSIRHSGGMAEVAEVDDDSLCESLHLPTFTDKVSIEDWPPLLQAIMREQDTPEMRDMMVMGSLVALSALTPNYFAIYDRRRVHPPFYFTVPAPAASGKGDIAMCRYLVDPSEADIRQANEVERGNYERDMAAWQQLDKKQRAEIPCPKEPPYRSIYASANSSTTALCQSLNDNHGAGLILETEGSVISGTLKTEYGDYSAVLCKAFQHEAINYARRTENERVNIDAPHLALIMTLTPGQVQVLLPSYESGLGSRLTFYCLSRNLSWRNVFAEEEQTAEDRFRRLGEHYRRIYRELSARKKHPLQFKFSPQQQRDFNEYFSSLQLEQVLQQGDDLTAIVRRLGLVTHRIAMMLTLLRHVDIADRESYPPAFNEEDQAVVCEDIDYRIAMTISNCLIAHAAYVYATLVPHSTAAQSLQLQALSADQQRFYNALPKDFLTADYHSIAKQLNISQRTSERYIGDLSNKYRLLQRIKTGHYVKL